MRAIWQPITWPRLLRLLAHLSEWTIADVIAAGYAIDEPLAWDDTKPITIMAEVVGLKRNALGKLFDEFAMDDKAKTADGTRPVAYWQIAALVDFELLPTPSFLRKRAEVEA